MDKKRSILNVTVSILFKFLLLFLSLLARRFLIRELGNEVNGLNSLYLSIIGFLSVAELGIGTAIAFSIYKPIVENNTKKIAALYYLYKKICLIIGAFIFISGCVLMPFLPYFARDYAALDVNIYRTFFLMLVSVCLTYTYSSKIALINAFKNNYITTIITSSCETLRYGIQIFVLINIHSFELYLCCRIFTVIVEWIFTSLYTERKYPNIVELKNEKLDIQTKQEVTNSVKAMFMHKIGGVLVSTADSMIISAFIGVAILGKYSNYTVIMTSMTGILSLFFTPLTSIIGHLYAEGNKDNTLKYFNVFFCFNFVIGIVFFLGYYSIIDNIVTIVFGNELELSRSIAFIITLNHFIQFMRKSILLFKDASGVFYNDRWKPLFEGIINVILSILFVIVFPDDYKVVGVIVATIITTLTICYTVEPHVLFKYAFRESPKQFYIKYFLSIGLFVIALFALNVLMVSIDNPLIELLINGVISIGVSIVICIFICIIDAEFKRQIAIFSGQLFHRIKRHER